MVSSPMHNQTIVAGERQRNDREDTAIKIAEWGGATELTVNIRFIPGIVINDDCDSGVDYNDDGKTTFEADSQRSLDDRKGCAIDPVVRRGYLGCRATEFGSEV